MNQVYHGGMAQDHKRLKEFTHRYAPYFSPENKDRYTLGDRMVYNFGEDSVSGVKNLFELTSSINKFIINCPLLNEEYLQGKILTERQSAIIQEILLCNMIPSCENIEKISYNTWTCIKCKSRGGITNAKDA